MRRLIPPERLPSLGITLKNEQLKNLEAAGLFPRRVRVTARTHAYVEDEIHEYAESKIAQRDAEAAHLSRLSRKTRVDRTGPMESRAMKRDSSSANPKASCAHSGNARAALPTSHKPS